MTQYRQSMRSYEVLNNKHIILNVSTMKLRPSGARLTFP